MEEKDIVSSIMQDISNKLKEIFEELPFMKKKQAVTKDMEKVIRGYCIEHGGKDGWCKNTSCATCHAYALFDAGFRRVKVDEETEKRVARYVYGKLDKASYSYDEIRQTITFKIEDLREVFRSIGLEV